MRASLGSPIRLVCLLVVTSVACSGNAPLPTGNTNAGTAGMHLAAGGAGHGGSTSTGAAGAVLTGVAGATAAAGAGPGAAGAFGGPAGTVGTAGTSPVGPTGQAGASGVAMCGSPSHSDGTCVAGAYKRSGTSGTCQCQDDAPCVCPGVGCVDPMTDDDNCGTCGIHCAPTSTCNNGVCGPAPVQIVPPQPGCRSTDLAIGGGMLYWTDDWHATVKRMPLAVGNQQTIATGEKPSRLVVSGTTAAWLYSTAAIRVSLDGAPPTFVVTSAAQIGGLALTPDATTLFFSSGNDVSSLPVAGGAPVVVVHEVKGGIPGALALTGSGGITFPTSLNGDVEAVTLVPGQVVSCGLEDPVTGEPLPNTNCARLGRSQGELFVDAILYGAPIVIWADGPNVKSELFAGTGVFDSVAMSDNPITGLAMTADAAVVYFADTDPASGTGVIYKSSSQMPTQTAVRIARAQRGPRSLAVGGTKVYWSTSDCAIMSQGL